MTALRIDHTGITRRISELESTLFLENGIKYFGLVELFGAKKPVMAMHIVYRFHSFLGNTTRACRGYNDIIARLPVCWGCHTERIGGLQGKHHAVQFVKVAAEAQRIVDNRSHDAFWVDHKDCAHGLCTALPGHDHAVFRGDFHRDILDQRKGDLDILHAFVFDLFLDGAQPSDMAVQSVDGQTHEFAVGLIEFAFQGSKSHEFGGANGCKVSRVAEENDPTPRIVSREMDRTLGRNRLEFGRIVADAWHCNYLLFHDKMWLKSKNIVSLIVAVPRWQNCMRME